MWYATNLLEEVDQPGEYWIDRVAGGGLLPAPGRHGPRRSSGAEAIVSELRGFLLWVDNTASYIQFQGLTFEATQGDMVYVDAGSHNITFGGCRFRKLGRRRPASWPGRGTSSTAPCSTGSGSIGLVLKDTASNITLSYNEVHRHRALPAPRHRRHGRLAAPATAIRHNVFHHLPWAALDYHARGSVVELNEFYATQQQGG